MKDMRKLIAQNSQDYIFLVPHFPRQVFWWTSQNIDHPSIKAQLRFSCALYIDKETSEPIIHDFTPTQIFDLFQAASVKPLTGQKHPVLGNVPLHEWPRILSDMSEYPPLSRGSWVRIKKGRYRNDVGVVLSCTAVCSSVLLIPRLEYNWPSLWEKRRRASYRPRLSGLFEPRLVQLQKFPAVLIEASTRKYQYRSRTYSCGLLLVLIPTADLDIDVVSISSTAAGLFLQSEHPAIHPPSLPRVTGWSFQEGEVVKCRSVQVEGVAAAVTSEGPTIRTPDGGLLPVVWHDAVKVFLLGDNVRVCDGPHAGKQAWVERVEKTSVFLMTKQDVHEEGAENYVQIEVSTLSTPI